MSGLVPTVRVANPAVPDGFMTIDRDAYGPEHDLWHDQAPGFVPPSAPKPIIDPAERDLCAEILFRMVPAHYGINPDEWAGLAGSARLDCLRAFEMDTAKAEPSDRADVTLARLAGSDLPAAALALPVAKGPRGLWYVMRGDSRASRGFATETEAMTESARTPVP